ncbi:MAG: prepilin-type N-terminal cleavage/methylation domain-containing protein [Planctomycetes bacterium]|nr:prepilin-type N-terminal cleavage/methylation domain-containing protein [Planctomycetota bacterium]
MHAKPTGRSGFTYIELTITMLVMGILGAIAIPTYVSTLANYRANLAASRIVADLHYARSEAQRNSLIRNVVFNTGSNSYTLTGVADTDHSTNNYIVNLVDAPFSATLVSATFGAYATVTFDRYGRPDNTGTVVVQSGSVQKTITLAADGTATLL